MSSCTGRRFRFVEYRFSILCLKKSQCQEDDVKLIASLNAANPMSNMKVGNVELNCSANYPKLEYDNGDRKLDWMTINNLEECLKADDCVIHEGAMTTTSSLPSSGPIDK